MKEYKHILLALELTHGGDELPIKKAKELAQLFGAKISVVHAVEHVSSYGAAYGVAAGADIEEILLENAVNEMRKIAELHGFPENNRIVRIGPAKIIILEEAERLGADLIVVGSHGRHGIRLLLGSTANAVLHGAACDVLAVRIKD